jgi:hypothetical protein
VFLYAYRHSFAQRHADAGTPVDVLRDLMGHRSMSTTQGYYSITTKRVRTAVDQLATFQFDRNGTRVWRQARSLLESEHQRRAVGQIAVPFGVCTEPSNVKAGGQACPFRFRCMGCGHFRSDPSYLPELRGYLDTLLKSQERLRAATELDDWARAEAMPSDEEIRRSGNSSAASKTTSHGWTSPTGGRSSMRSRSFEPPARPPTWACHLSGRPLRILRSQRRHEPFAGPADHRPSARQHQPPSASAGRAR